MRPYTRTGDCGQTSLASGQRVSKTCARLEAYGTIDELNSHIGLLIAYSRDAHDRDVLTAIQNRLFVVGGELATISDNTTADSQPHHTQAVAFLEHEIDDICLHLPQLHSFILPGGTPAAAQCHVCRTVCRRVERRILALQAEEGITIDASLVCYVNRLSDYLFVLARKCNIDENHDEIIWQKEK